MPQDKGLTILFLYSLWVFGFCMTCKSRILFKNSKSAENDLAAQIFYFSGGPEYKTEGISNLNLR